MRTITTLLTTAALAVGTIAATAGPAAAAGYTYGPKGSCTVQSGSQKGKKGYKEYYNGRATGRCVLQ